MKQTLVTFSIVGTILTILAFTNYDSKSVGAIGDVKYSVLTPDKFKEENGKGWVLMDNNIPLENSDLKNKHGVQNLPDARGLFIRSLNGLRNDDMADPYFKEKNIQRQVGDVQFDTFKKHHHNLNVIIGAGVWSYGDNVPGRGWACQWSDRPEILDSHTDGSNETRPKNIALYLYIKIND